MKYNYPLFLFLIFTTCSISAQEADSLKLVDQFENYEFANNASVEEYLELLLNYENDVSAKDRIRFGTKGAEAAAVFKNDSLYIDFYLNVIDVYAAELYDIEKTKELLDLIASKVASLNVDLYSGNYYHLRGMTYHLEGDYKNALDSYAKSYQYAKKIAPQKARGSLYNIRNIYHILGDSKNALKYSEEALSLNEYLPERDVYLNTAMANYHIGTNYRDEFKQDSTFYFIQKALAAISHLDSLGNFSELQTYCEVNLEALILFSTRGDQPKVDSLLKKVTKCKGHIEPFYSIYMADYYLMKGEFDKVPPLIADTSTIRNNVWARNILLKTQSSYEEGVGSYKKALDFHKKHMDLTLEIRDEEQRNYASFIGAQFDAVKRDAEIATLKQKTEADKLRSKLLIFAVLLLLTSLLMALYAYRKSKHNNHLLKNDLKNKKIIERQSEKLKKTEALKSKLFTNISHELRTPLTLISGPIERLLKKVDIDNTDKNQLLLARNSSRQLLSLSDQLMDLTKSEFGDVKLNLNHFHWDDFLNSLIPRFSANAEKKNLIFSEHRHYSENILMQSDVTKLKVVLNNLVQNAFKFSVKGGEVHLDSIDKGDQLEFSVRDTGRGIDKGDLPHVFERYYQSINNTEGGFGIGLAVCQEYVQLLGGEIGIKSNPGEGTTVTVSLPKTIITNDSVAFYPFDSEAFIPMPLPVAVEGVLTDQNSAHLLIVEDNTDLCEYLGTILSDEYRLSFAQNGEEALKKLEEINPALIITDWMMPVMDGLEFVKNLREDPRWQKLPVLMLTARSMPIDQVKAFQKGMDDYLLKPFEADVIKFRIEHLLGFAAGRKEEPISVMEYDKGMLQEQGPHGIAFQNVIKVDRKDMAWLSNLEEIIQSQIGNFDLSVDSISQAAGVSTAHLHRKTKAITGLPPKQFIDEIRFWEARRILEEKEQHSVKAVSYSVGFKSVKNFSKNFKKRFGKNPSEYLD